MNGKLKAMLWVLAFVALNLSCNQNEDLIISPEQDQTEISLMEKESGITFYKEEITLKDAGGGNSAVLIIAAKDHKVLKDYIAAIEISIKPVYRSDFSEKRTDVNSNLPSNDGKINVNTDGIYMEFLSTDLDTNVIGLSTSIKIIEKDKNGRTSANGFPNQVTVTSGTWAELFRCTTYQTVKYKFEAKTNRLSGWSTRTFCNYDFPSLCMVDWEQLCCYEQRTWVDGPYRIRAVIDYFYATDFTWEFVDY